MAKINLCTSGAGLSTAPATTYYIPLGQSGSVIRTTEANTQVTFRVGGVLSDLQGYIATSNLNGTSTLRVRINGGNGTQSASINASTTGEFVDGTPANTDTVAVADEVNYSFVTGGATGAQSIVCFQCNFTADTNTATRYINAIDITQADATTRYRALSDSAPDSATTEAYAQIRLNSGNTTFSNMFAYVSANGVNSNSSVTLRDDGSAVITLSITASTTGIFENTADTANPADNSLVCFATIVPSVSGTYYVVFQLISVVGTSTDGTFYAISGNANGSNTSTTNNYFTFNGRGASSSASSQTARDLLVAGNISDTSVYVSANTANGTSTYTLRKNDSDTTLQMSIGATATGLFEDTDSVSFTSTDQPVFYAVRGGTGTLTTRTAGAMITIPSEAGTVVKDLISGFIPFAR